MSPSCVEIWLEGRGLGTSQASPAREALSWVSFLRMRIRRPSWDDLGPALALLQECDRDAYGGSDWTEVDLRSDWEELGLQDQVWLAEVDGELAGVAMLFERPQHMDADGYVHPEKRGRGVGTAMLEVMEERARNRGAAVLHCAYLLGDKTAAELLAANGFVYGRSFLRMVVTHQGPPPPPSWPLGIQARQLSVAAEGPAFHACLNRAFAEEWKFHPEPYEIFARRRLGAARFDESLCWVAWKDEVAVGITLCDWKRMGDWGWISSLGVVPEWRRRGLGRALLLASFGEFWRRREPTVALGVDTQNPSGASRLYERAGMRELWRADVWRKQLSQD